MKTWMVAVAVGLIACGSKGKPGEYEFKTSLKTDSGRQSGLPNDGFASYEDGTPKLAVTGSATPLVDAMRAKLETNPLVLLGNVNVELVLPAAMPKLPNGKTVIEIKLAAVYVAAPDVIKLDATIKGDVTYSGATVELFGKRLADEVTKHIGTQKIPANAGPMPKAAKIAGITVGPPDCTLHEDKTIRCWEHGDAPTPIPRAGKTIAVDAGNNYGVCGVREEGSVYCIDAWDNTVALEVRDVCGVAGATGVSTGQQSACALLTDGTVKCWGRRPEWFEPSCKHQAVAVKGVTDAVALHVGPFQACVVTKGGNAQCWELCGKDCKSDVVGEVGSTPPTATAKKGISKATLVHAVFNVCGASGDTVTCVDKTTKKTWTVKLPEPITKLTHTHERMCGLTTSKKVVCWPLYIQEKGKPEVLAEFSDVIALDGDITGMCAATSSNEVLCWGGMDNVPADKPRRIKP